MRTSNNRSWFSAKSTGQHSAEINIDNEIGAFGVRASDFRDELKAFGDVTQIQLHINSPGGEVFDSLAIHNMLARHKAEIIVTIDGIAASGASLVAMAGDQIIMPENAMMMIHDPGGIVVGTSKEMRELADALDKVKSGMISAYAAKSMQERNTISEIMAAETWLTAQEAVDLGFADKVEAPIEMTASFDLSKFKHAPADAGRRPRGLTAHDKSQEVTVTDAEKAAAAEAEKKAKIELEAKAKVEAEAKLKAEAEAKAKAEADAAAAGKTETPAQIEARVRAEMIETHKQIAAACDLAGMSGKATDFIAAGKKLPEVLAELQTLRAAKGGKGKTETEINTHLSGNAEISASWNKQVDKHNARLPSGRAA